MTGEIDCPSDLPEGTGKCKGRRWVECIDGKIHYVENDPRCVSPCPPEFPEGTGKCVDDIWYECINGWLHKTPNDQRCVGIACPPDIPEGTYKCIGEYSYECIGGRLHKVKNDPRCIDAGPTPSNGTACPIACVCMGTTLIDALGPIREFRDFVLKKSKNGKRFVSLYYNQIGPSLTYVLNKSEMLRKAGRLVVKAILKKLEK